MALVKPIALSINAFDATQSQVFKFTSSGGDLVTANRLTISDNSTNTIIYQQTQQNYKFEHTVLANTLTNGTYYNFYFNTLDSSGNMSLNSNVIQFYCYSNPVLTLNIIDNQVIKSSQYTFEATYTQAQGELLNGITFNLYDSNNNLISKSNPYYSSQVPPLTISHTFDGFNESSAYKISVDGVTINGTPISTEIINFTTSFFYPEVYTLFELTNNCNEGYNRIKNNVTLLDGITNPTIPVYISGTKLDIGNIGDYVKWVEGFQVPNDFLMRIWLTPSLLGEFFKVWSSESESYLMGSFVRNRPYGETSVKDYFQIEGIDPTTTIHNLVFDYSNFISPMNNTTDLFVWIKKVGNVYTCILEVLAQTDNKITWNGSSNVEYNRLTNLFWQDETYVMKPQMSKFARNLNIFPITNVQLENGIYDNFDITRDTTIAYTNTIPQWTYNTILNCNFNNNVSGGNINVQLSKLTLMRIKRRKSGTFNWNTLYEIPIKSASDLNFIKDDTFWKSGETYEYAIVPVLNGTEGDYITKSVYSECNGVFLSDTSGIYKFFAQVEYGDVTDTMDIGQYQTIGSKYPTLIINGNTNYQQGTTSGAILGKNYDITRIIDRQSVVELSEEIRAFLKNNKPKILKDWNGNCWLCSINASPNVSFDNSFGMGKVNVTFSWVEQGKYDNQEDLEINGMVQ